MHETSHTFSGPCAAAWSWEWLIELGHPSTLHWPADGQFQLLKGAEKDQVLTEDIRAAAVGSILWGSQSTQ